MPKNYHVAIVGATGAVGIELLRVMERRNFPVADLRLLASPRSAGKKLEFRGQDLPVAALDQNSFAGIDLAFFSAGAGTAKQFAPIAQRAGAVVIDNSSAFRMEPDVPLVIPEINPEDVRRHRGVIANPNCTTAVALMALYPAASRVRSASRFCLQLSGCLRQRRARDRGAAAASRSDRRRRPGRSLTFILIRSPSTSFPTSIHSSRPVTRGKR